jgi:hypothetical protein
MGYKQAERQEMAFERLALASGRSRYTPSCVAKFGVRRLAAAFAVL